MRCSACQTELPDDASVCPACSRALLPEGEAATLGEGTHPVGPTALSLGEAPTVPAGGEMARIEPEAIPQRLDNYELLRRPDGTIWELGRGAMGITYKAFDTDLHVDVVLKVIKPEALANAGSRSRFLREARAAAKLRHPNIATIFRLDEIDGVQFYAMEFCDGQTVHEFVEQHGPLELKLALEIALQVTNALVVAQELGIVHRDIKPANLMITGSPPEEFTVKVIDFGLAKLGAPGTAAADVTDGSARFGFVGTAHFASPEQLEDRPVDFRSDIYSLGVTLYFMLTARPLFEGTMARVVMQQLAEVPALDKLAWLPEQTHALLAKMLAKKPEGRPASTRELRAALRACLEEASDARRVAAAPRRTNESSPAHVDTGADIRFAPPGERTVEPPSSIATLRPALPASAKVAAPSGPPLPKPKLVIRTVVIAAAGLLTLLFIAALVFALTPLSKWPFREDAAQPGPVPTTDAAERAVSSPEVLAALRNAREAQDAAETLSLTIRRREKNAQLLQDAEKSSTPDPEKIRTYRAAAEALERKIRDAEAAYLIAGKSLGTFPPETQRAAFAKLVEEVVASGSAWRARAAEIIRENIPQLALDAVRIDSATRDRLGRLQTDD